MLSRSPDRQTALQSPPVRKGVRRRRQRPNAGSCPQQPTECSKLGPNCPPLPTSGAAHWHAETVAGGNYAVGPGVVSLGRKPRHQALCQTPRHHDTTTLNRDVWCLGPVGAGNTALARYVCLAPHRPRYVQGRSPWLTIPQPLTKATARRGAASSKSGKPSKRRTRGVHAICERVVWPGGVAANTGGRLKPRSGSADGDERHWRF
jgi:hypothetical protein